MATTATWFIVIGFVLLVAGLVLRIVIMMRASDATASEHQTLHGRELVGQFRRMFPHSPALLITRWLLLAGTILLLAGLGIQFLHYRAGLTAFGVTLLSFHGNGLGIPGGIDIATIFSSAIPALVSRIT
jgi:hypothetical protein